MQNSKNWSPALAPYENSDITTWELPEDAIARLGQGLIMPNTTSYSPDGKHFACGSTIGIWWYDLSTMATIDLWDTDRGYIDAVSFSPNGKWLATADGDGLVKVWDWQRGVCISQMERNEAERSYDYVSHLVFSPDSQLLAISNKRDYILYVWNTETWELIAKFHDNTNYIWAPILRRPIAFSPDGSLIACTMPDERLFTHADLGWRIPRIPKTEHTSNYIAIWNIKTGEQLTCLTEHPDFVYSVVFSPCGKFLASGGRDGAIRVWSVINWELLHTFQNLGTERKKVFYSPEGVLHALEVSDAFILWDVACGEKCERFLEEHIYLHDAHVPKGTSYVLASKNPREFRKWTVSDFEPRSFPHLHTGVPFSLVFAPDGKTLAGGYWSENEKVMLWDITQPSSLPSSFNLPGREYIVSVSSQGKIYATGRDGKIARVWDIGNTDTPVATFTLPNEKRPLVEQERQVSKAAFAHKSNKLACGDSDGMLYVWDVQKQHIQHACEAHDEGTYSLAFSPNEKLLVSISSTGPKSRMWDVESGESIEAFPNKFRAIAFSDCSRLIACGRIRELLLWDTVHCEIILTLPLPQESFYPFALAFSPCGGYLASGAWWIRDFGMKKCPVLLWDVSSGKNIAAFRGHSSDVQCLAFSPDSEILASGGYDGAIMLWDIKPYIDV